MGYVLPLPLLELPQTRLRLDMAGTPRGAGEWLIARPTYPLYKPHSDIFSTERRLMRTCDYCSRKFEAKRSDARYCSDACRKADKRAVRDNDVRDNPKELVRASDGRRTPVKDNPVALRREADRLTKLQKHERGAVPGPTIEGKKTIISGPYVPTPEREARAGQIIALRKRAARLEFPTSHSSSTPVKVSHAQTP